MRLKVKKLMEGPGPNEVVVAVRTSAGFDEQVVVDRRAVTHGTIEIGNPIHRKGAETLVELPRETASGTWRLWVSGSAVTENPQ